jgi:hypothetical protein
LRKSLAKSVSEPPLGIAYSPGVAVVVSGTSKTFEPAPVVICSRPKPVPGSMRKGENAMPAALEIPGMANSLSLPPIPRGRCARFGDGKYV